MILCVNLRYLILYITFYYLFNQISKLVILFINRFLRFSIKINSIFKNEFIKHIHYQLIKDI